MTQNLTITRRTALGAVGAGALLPGAAAARPEAAVQFLHGIASGDPTARGAILWTRVTPPAGHTAPVAVTWHVAEGGTQVDTGRTEARAARDYTVKVEPTKLKPGHDYTFWFEAAGTTSPQGRFRTLPEGALAELNLAVVSCQLYGGGLFNAYDAIAKLERLDAIVHLGDYIYEYGRDGYGKEIAQQLGREVEPPHEILRLADYRTRHAQYKRDPDLQAAHARAAMIAVWDDHETANDSYREGAENHQPESEGDWAKRKAAAMQAYFEWMPIRDPAPGKPWEAINRAFQFGDLATLAMVETRLLARSMQAEFKGATPSPEAFGAVLAERDRDDRELLGEPQRAWLEGVLTQSVEARTPWQVLGNQVVMARVPGPDLQKMLGPIYTGALAKLPAPIRTRVEGAQASYRAGLPFNLDSWDGYPAARERLYASFRRAGSHPLVLSGDSHAFWCNALADAGGTAVGSEFGTSAISSPSIGDSVPQVPLGKLLEQAGPEVLFCDQRGKGFILLTLTPERVVADYRAMSTIVAKPYEAKSVARYEVAARDRKLRRV